MAGFSTEVEVDLVVNKLKNIALEIDKDVDSSFNGENVLADAEAFADAQGVFVPGGGLGAPVAVFLIDGYGDDQEVIAGPGDVETDTLDPLTDTDLSNATRTVTVDNPGPGNADFETNLIPSFAEFDNGALTAATITIDYDFDTPADLIPDGFSEDDAALQVTDLTTDTGSELTFRFEDADGDIFEFVEVDPGGTANLDLTIPFSTFTDTNGAGDGTLDLDNIVDIVVIETGEIANDTVFDSLHIFAPPVIEAGALLAETLTVTQVDGFKANAYSQSTSGFDPGDAFDLIV